MNVVEIPQSEVPEEYRQRCEAGELGGVFVVFLNGRNTTEINEKVAELQRFAKRLSKKYSKPTHSTP